MKEVAAVGACRIVFSILLIQFYWQRVRDRLPQ
jgi:hypothetical protein